VSRRWLDDALQATALPTVSQFPRDLATDVVLHLPITIELVPGLTSHSVRGWLRARGINHEVSDEDRALHGCVVARGGQAVAFLDAGDEEAEQRFTLGHEIAHFLLDHLLPRRRALRIFGEQILPLLDGERPATRDEMLSAALEQVRLGVQVHLMGRGIHRAVCAWEIEESEQRADRLALELLAPVRAATSALRRLLGSAEDLAVHEKRAADHFATQFGLPAQVASSYVRLLLGRRRRASLSEEIFGETEV